MKKEVIIIGAGPAGLTFAYELLKRSDDYTVTVLECDNQVGGLSKTMKFGKLRLDIGGHRFYTKSERVQKMFDEVGENIFLRRKRLSRIFFMKNFFYYPLKLSFKMFQTFGLIESILVCLSYLYGKLFFRQEVKTLEEFFISRFGRRLYWKFFKGYTEKVWGISCCQIDAKWGAQRIKNLSMSEILLALFFGESKKKHTSLIEEFLYPKHGPGEFWETVLGKCEENENFKIYYNARVEKVREVDGEWAVTVDSMDYIADFCVNTMSLRDLAFCMQDSLPPKIYEVASALEYRDFLTVGLLLNDFHLTNDPSYVRGHQFLPDNWLYIQDEDVKVGRVQIFNNWSPYLSTDVKEPWIGLEYFCQEGDDFWSQDDEDICQYAFSELVKIGLVDNETLIKSSHVVRARKAYPKYTGAYENITKVQSHILGLKSFFSIGRNGMHRYNNQDHSMLSAMKAVDSLFDHHVDKDISWSVNTESEYSETK